MSQRVGGRFAKLWFLYREDNRAVVLSDSGDIEFYDLESDPQMKNNLGVKPATPFDHELQQRARSIFSEVHIEANSEAIIELDHQTRRQLQHLGYGS